MRLVGWSVCALLAAAAPALGQGLVEEPNAVYSAFPTTVRFRSFLPPEVDLSAAFPEPGTQGDQPSCVAWAVGYGLRSYYEHWRRGWDVNDTHHIASPAFIYDQLVRNKTCATGTTISDALNLLQNVGAASLADAPYDPRECRIAASVPLASSAGGFRIDSWRRVDVSVLDNVKGELHNGNPVVFGINISNSFYDLRGDAIYDDVAAPRTIGHAMVLVGYSEQRQAFKVMNSWGDGWGDHGFGWVSYRAFSKFVDRAFVVRVSGTPPIETFMASLRTPTSTPAAQANVAKPAPEPPAAKPAPPPPTTTLATLTKSLDTYDCADVALRQGALEGFVASDDDRARLTHAVQSIDPAQRPTDAVAVRPWPQCEALLTFAAPLAEPHGLAVAVDGGAPATLARGQEIVLDITAPDFPSYLYVAYVQASGDVVHLYRPGKHARPRARARRQDPHRRRRRRSARPARRRAVRRRDGGGDRRGEPAIRDRSAGSGIRARFPHRLSRRLYREVGRRPVGAAGRGGGGHAQDRARRREIGRAPIRSRSAGRPSPCGCADRP